MKNKPAVFVQTDPQVLYHKGFGHFGPIGNTDDLLFGRWRQFSPYGSVPRHIWGLDKL